MMPPCTIRLCLGELMSFWGQGFLFSMDLLLGFVFFVPLIRV